MQITVTSTCKNPLSARLPGGGSITIEPGSGTYPRADVEAAREHTGLGSLFGSVLTTPTIDLESEVAAPSESAPTLEVSVEPVTEEDSRLTMHWGVAKVKIRDMTDADQLRSWREIEHRDSVKKALDDRLVEMGG